MAAIGCYLSVVQVDNGVRHVFIFRRLLGYLLQFDKIIAQQVALAERRKVGGQGEGTLLRFMQNDLALSLFNHERHQPHDRTLDHDDHRDKFCPQIRWHQGGQTQEPLPAAISHGASSLLTGLLTLHSCHNFAVLAEGHCVMESTPPLYRHPCTSRELLSCTDLSATPPFLRRSLL